MLPSSSSGQLVTYDDQGLVVSGAAIQSSDLPLGSDSQVGAVMPGSGLSVGVDGALNHANSVVSGTAPKITFDTEGHVTAGQALLPSDIPDLPLQDHQRSIRHAVHRRREHHTAEAG